MRNNQTQQRTRYYHKATISVPNEGRLSIQDLKKDRPDIMEQVKQASRA